MIHHAVGCFLFLCWPVYGHHHHAHSHHHRHSRVTVVTKVEKKTVAIKKQEPSDDEPLKWGTPLGELVPW
jgi:hypothetical protein